MKRKLQNRKSRRMKQDEKVELTADSARNTLRDRVGAQREFQKLGLATQLASVCTQVGWNHPSAVQRYCIPRIISPCEYFPQGGAGHLQSPLVFAVQAPPGSGKTASYILPVLHHLMNSSTTGKVSPTASGQTRHAPRTFLHFFSSLVIAPTNELCLQIYNQFLLFGEALRVKIGLIVGGGSRKGPSKSNFLEQLSMVHDKTVHVIVGTPGRIEYILLDSSATAATSSSDSEDGQVATPTGTPFPGVLSILQNLNFFVMDEADMLMSEESMASGVHRILSLTAEAKRDTIIEQSAELSPEVDNSKNHPNFSIILASATLKKNTVNQVWASCAKALNHIQENTAEFDCSDPSSYAEKLQYVPPLPAYYIANDTMSVDSLTASSFNSLVEQQFLLCPDHVKLVHLFLLLSPSSESCIFHHESSKSSTTSQKRKAIVFFNSKMGCEISRITLQQLGLPTCALHSMQSPQQRSDSLFSFQMNVHSILLTTDVCCRGLDISSVDFIIHYDIPRTIDRYIHRIGRAVRESVHQESERLQPPSLSDTNVFQGQSILFVTEKDKRTFRKLEKSVLEIMQSEAAQEIPQKKWKLKKRREVKEADVLRYIDVVLQARLKSEEIVGDDPKSSVSFTLASTLNRPEYS